MRASPTADFALRSTRLSLSFISSDDAMLLLLVSIENNGVAASHVATTGVHVVQAALPRVGS